MEKLLYIYSRASIVKYTETDGDINIYKYIDYTEPCSVFLSSPVLPHFYFLSSQTAYEGFSSKDDWLKVLVSQSMDVM